MTERIPTPLAAKRLVYKARGTLPQARRNMGRQNDGERNLAGGRGAARVTAGIA